MFIRRTVSKNRKGSREKYYTYRLVESYRIGGKVRQRVLLNLGSDFNVDKAQWSVLANRIEDIIKRRPSLFECDKELEALAQQYAQQLISASEAKSIQAEEDEEYQSIDVHTIEQINPRSIGCEHIVYETIKTLKLETLFASLGFTPTQIDSALGILIAKACHPGSEAKSINYLRYQSGAGELYGCDYHKISDSSLYRIADTLIENKGAIEQHLYHQSRELFDYEEAVTLYDLTNTYFEGAADAIEKAARGRSKEKRSDAKLVTLAVVLDRSGFIKKSTIFEGNISEPSTLKEMIETLGVPSHNADQPHSSDDRSPTLPETHKSSLVVMDAGIASQENIDYLKENGYEYLVVSRKQKKQFDPDKAVEVKTDKKDNNVLVRAQRVEIKDEEGKIEEIELYCHSKPRKLKEDSIQQRAQSKFTQALDYLDDGLSIPRRMKNYEKVLQKVGALKSEYASIAKYYTVTVKKDPDSPNALSVTYKEKRDTEDKSVMNGVYCLRTNNTTMDEKSLWRTYTTLTDLEAVFRTLKSELGLRPVYHRTGERVDGHLFITLMAYTIIHTIRYTLKAKGIHDSWETIREKLSTQIRTTTVARIEDGRVLYLRKSSLLDERAKEIVDALGLSHRAGGVSKVYQ